jgi:hypothetical protein
MHSDSNQTGQDRPAFSVASALLLAVALLWCIYWFVHAWHYWEDDAYIHLEFARSVASGQGFAFNGRVVAGDTAPLWVLFLAGMHALIPDWLVAGKALTMLGAALGLSGAYAYARSLASSLLPSSQSAAIFPAAMVLLIVANPYSCYWIFSGMEPIAAAGLAFWAVLAATRESPSAKTFLAACGLAGIAPLIRPEMIFLTGLLAFALLGQWRKLPGRPTSSAKLRVFAAGLVLIAAPLTLWSIYSFHAFGHVLPNTNAAKRAAPGDSVVRHLVVIYSLALPVIVCGLLAGIAYLIRRPSAVRHSIQNAFASAFGTAQPIDASQRSKSLPLAGWIFILWPSITTIFYIADHTYVQTRYILVTAPGLTIVLLMLALMVSRRTGRVVYLAALVAAVAVSLITVRPFIRNKGINCDVTKDLAIFIRDHIPSDAPVALYGIGEIAFLSQHPIIDTGGITRPGAIPYLNEPPQVMVRWARSEGAQYIISNKPELGAILVFSADQRFAIWTFRTELYETYIPIQLWQFAPLSGTLSQTDITMPNHP